MNYYIQGDAANADKIKAAFEKLGYEILNVIHIGDYANERLFFFTENGKVRSTLKDCGIVNIIKTHPDYQELELPVEPKFKVGDWIVYKDGRTFCGGFKQVQVRAIEGSRYIFTQATNGSCEFIDKNCRLWTIADAKDGDVFAASDGSIFINAGSDDGGCKHHVALAITGSIVINEGLVSHWETASAVKPATKKQRDLLFTKMKEAGYQWDADKKELRKIQPHYGIANFHIGMPVLVREYDTCVWQWVQYSHFNGVGLFFAAGKTWRQCIPFNDDTKHLLGTMDMPSEEFINW